MATHHYYNQMNKQQQAAYYAMLEGFRSLETSFAVPRLDVDRELFDVHFLMRLDHPELFYSEGIKYRFYDNSTNVEVVPEYLFEKKKIKETAIRN